MATGSRSQRDRILGAMVQVAAAHGYAGASVAMVIERAEVSRAAFYRHFAGKDACCLAAFQELAETLRRRVRAAARSSARDRPRAVVKALLEEINTNPAAARLVFVEGLGASPAIRIEHQNLLAETEAAVEAFLVRPSPRAPRLQIPAAAALGGIADVLSMRVNSEAPVSIDSLLGDIQSWLEAYAAPVDRVAWDPSEFDRLGRRAGRSIASVEGGQPLRLPRGASAIDPRAAGADRRRRILLATAATVRADGYHSATVAAICAAARVSRAAFYSHFGSKKEAILDALTLGLRESMAAAAAAFAVAPSWPERVWNSMRALIAYLASHPNLTHLGMVESYAAGSAAIRRAHDARMAYDLFLKEGYQLRASSAPLPPLCSEAIAGANFHIFRSQVARGRTGEMLEVLPKSAYVTLAPFIGPAPALEFVRERSRTQLEPEPQEGAPGLLALSSPG